MKQSTQRMQAEQAPPPEQTSWQFMVVLAVIVGAVLGLILKTAGVF